jgi:hypothetical protein
MFIESSATWAATTTREIVSSAIQPRVKARVR